MSERRYEVRLGDIRVGMLAARDDGQVSFRFEDAYSDDPGRPVLGQVFEDDLSRTYLGNAAGALPGYFANLLPEGALRGVLERSLGDSAFDDVSLLAALGGDLPGAVIVRPASDVASALKPDSGSLDGSPDDEHSGLRFSLAGVQLKFSMLATGKRLTLPGHGVQGDWIVKLGSATYPHLVENEFATMEWARACGFDVPDCRLHGVDALNGLPRRHALDDSPVLAVRRFDRRPDRTRVHQEDFAQVMGRTRPPRSNGRYKYDSKIEALAGLVRTIVGDEGYLELVRRVAFEIASGNHDAHMKNWSLTYPDGRSAQLSPLYDQICTVAWPEHDRKLALKLGGTRHPGELNERSFRQLARKVAADEDATVRVAVETIVRARATWTSDMAAHMPDETHREAIVEYWRSVPLLRSVGPLD